jgi:hypothetical protein
MRYASPMSSSFVYHPHVHQSDGTVITPDIAIDRVFASGADGLAACPVSRLTSAAAIQQPAGAPIGTPAVILLAASYGLLIAPGVILEDALALSRAAWRLDDIRDGYGDVTLGSWTIEAGKKTAFQSETLDGLMSPTDVMGALGNASGLKPGTAVFIGHPAGLGESLSVDRFEVALQMGARTLNYGFEIEVLA